MSVTQVAAKQNLKDSSKRGGFQHILKDMQMNVQSIAKVSNEDFK